MKFIRLIIPLFALVVLLSNCRSPEQFSHSCEQPTTISAKLYDSAPKDHVTINKMDIEGDCLRINFSSSGCSGDSWVVKLIDAGVIMESYPPRRNLIFSLKNEEMCKAYITKEMTFDVSALKVAPDKVILQITNTGHEILFEY